MGPIPGPWLVQGKDVSTRVGQCKIRKLGCKDQVDSENQTSCNTCYSFLFKTYVGSKFDGDKKTKEEKTNKHRQAHRAFRRQRNMVNRGEESAGVKIGGEEEESGRDSWKQRMNDTEQIVDQMKAYNGMRAQMREQRNNHRTTPMFPRRRRRGVNRAKNDKADDSRCVSVKESVKRVVL